MYKNLNKERKLVCVGEESFGGIKLYLEVILKKKMIDNTEENMIGIYLYPIHLTENQ